MDISKTFKKHRKRRRLSKNEKITRRRKLNKNTKKKDIHGGKINRLLRRKIKKDDNKHKEKHLNTPTIEGWKYYIDKNGYVDFTHYLYFVRFAQKIKSKIDSINQTPINFELPELPRLNELESYINTYMVPPDLKSIISGVPSQLELINFKTQLELVEKHSRINKLAEKIVNPELLQLPNISELLKDVSGIEKTLKLNKLNPPRPVELVELSIIMDNVDKSSSSPPLNMGDTSKIHELIPDQLDLLKINTLISALNEKIEQTNLHNQGLLNILDNLKQPDLLQLNDLLKDIDKTLGKKEIKSQLNVLIDQLDLLDISSALKGIGEKVTKNKQYLDGFNTPNLELQFPDLLNVSLDTLQTKILKEVHYNKSQQEAIDTLLKQFRLLELPSLNSEMESLIKNKFKRQLELTSELFNGITNLDLLPLSNTLENIDLTDNIDKFFTALNSAIKKISLDGQTFIIPQNMDGGAPKFPPLSNNSNKVTPAPRGGQTRQAWQAGQARQGRQTRQAWQAGQARQERQARQDWTLEGHRRMEYDPARRAIMEKPHSKQSSLSSPVTPEKQIRNMARYDRNLRSKSKLPNLNNRSADILPGQVPQSNISSSTTPQVSKKMLPPISKRPGRSRNPPINPPLLDKKQPGSASRSSTPPPPPLTASRRRPKNNKKGKVSSIKDVPTTPDAVAQEAIDISANRVSKYKGKRRKFVKNALTKKEIKDERRKQVAANAQEVGKKQRESRKREQTQRQQQAAVAEAAKAVAAEEAAAASSAAADKQLGKSQKAVQGYVPQLSEKAIKRNEAQRMRANAKEYSERVRLENRERVRLENRRSGSAMKSRDKPMSQPVERRGLEPEPEPQAPRPGSASRSLSPRPPPRPRPGSATLSQLPRPPPRPRPRPRPGSAPLQRTGPAMKSGSKPRPGSATIGSRTPPGTPPMGQVNKLKNLMDEKKDLYKDINGFSFVPGLNYIIRNKLVAGSQEMENANHYLIQHNLLLSKNEDKDENLYNYKTYSMNFDKIHGELYSFIKNYSQVRDTNIFNEINKILNDYYSNNINIEKSVQEHIEAYLVHGSTNFPQGMGETFKTVYKVISLLINDIYNSSQT